MLVLLEGKIDMTGEVFEIVTNHGLRYYLAYVKGRVVISFPAGNMSERVDHRINDASLPSPNSPCDVLMDWFGKEWNVNGNREGDRFWHVARKGVAGLQFFRGSMESILFWIEVRQA